MPNGILYLIPVLIWGSTWLAIKFQLGVVAPELSIAYRFALAASILLIYSAGRRLSLRFNIRQHAFMALQGLLLFSLNYFLVYLSEEHLTSGLVAIIFSMIIIMNVLFGALLIRNPIRGQVLLGAVIGLSGLLLIFRPEIAEFDLSGARALGVVMAFLGVISASLGNIVSARNQKHALPVVQTNAFGMAYGSLIMVGFAVVRGAPLTFDPSFTYVSSLIYLALFGSIIAFTSYLTLLGRIGPDRAAYVTVLFPIIALILSTLFEDLQWGAPQFIGALLVLLGNAIVLTKRDALRMSKRVARVTVTSKKSESPSSK
jgi:drug/metabolite transporter (DMT)-like permease